MNSDQIASFIYLALLGSALVVWYFVSNRGSLNKVMQQAALWGLIFVGVIAAVGLWGDIRQASTFRPTISEETGEISVPREPDGHYYLTLDINDTPVRFVIDTGATDMVLTKEDAEAVGIDLENTNFLGTAQTANGSVKVASVYLDSVRIGQFTDREVRASVNDGEMKTSLLGMNYLHRFDRIEISGGQLVLTR